MVMLRTMANSDEGGNGFGSLCAVEATTAGILQGDTLVPFLLVIVVTMLDCNRWTQSETGTSWLEEDLVVRNI